MQIQSVWGDMCKRLELLKFSSEPQFEPNWLNQTYRFRFSPVQFCLYHIGLGSSSEDSQWMQNQSKLQLYTGQGGVNVVYWKYRLNIMLLYNTTMPCECVCMCTYQHPMWTCLSVIRPRVLVKWTVSGKGLTLVHHRSLCSVTDGAGLSLFPSGTKRCYFKG